MGQGIEQAVGRISFAKSQNLSGVIAGGTSLAFLEGFEEGCGLPA